MSASEGLVASIKRATSSGLATVLRSFILRESVHPKRADTTYTSATVAYG